MGCGAGGLNWPPEDAVQAPPRGQTGAPTPTRPHAAASPPAAGGPGTHALRWAGRWRAIREANPPPQLVCHYGGGGGPTRRLLSNCTTHTKRTLCREVCAATHTQKLPRHNLWDALHPRSRPPLHDHRNAARAQFRSPASGASLLLHLPHCISPRMPSTAAGAPRAGPAPAVRWMTADSALLSRAEAARSVRFCCRAASSSRRSCGASAAACAVAVPSARRSCKQARRS